MNKCPDTFLRKITMVIERWEEAGVHLLILFDPVIDENDLVGWTLVWRVSATLQHLCVAHENLPLSV